MSSMGYPHPIKGMGGDELLSKTQLMFGVGMGSGRPDPYKNALDMYLSFFKVIFSLCSHIFSKCVKCKEAERHCGGWCCMCKKSGNPLVIFFFIVK
jgi:hypothetical protein